MAPARALRGEPAEGPRPRFPGARRLIFTIMLALLAATLLASCSLHVPQTRPDASPARPLSAVHQELDRLPGVSVRNLTVEENGGQPWSTHLYADLELEPAFAGQQGALLDYVLALVWSSDEREPTSSIDLALNGPDSWIDASATLKELGLDAAFHSFRSVITPESMQARYGKWPGPVPARPDGLKERK